MTGCKPWRIGKWFALLVVLLGFLAAGAVAARSPLASFDFLVPKDPGSQGVARGVAYGASPRQHLDVNAPVATQNSLLPVVVFFYGGAWSSGRREYYAFVGRALAAQGFVVVIPDYRLVPEVRFPTFLEDGAAAVRWARRMPPPSGEMETASPSSATQPAPTTRRCWRSIRGGSAPSGRRCAAL